MIMLDTLYGVACNHEWDGKEKVITAQNTNMAVNKLFTNRQKKVIPTRAYRPT